MIDYLIQKGTELVIYHYKKLFVVMVIVIVLIFVGKIFSSYAILDISIINSTKSNEKPRIFISTDNSNEEIGGPGLHIVTRDTKSIIAQVGNNIRTQSRVDIPWYGLTAKKVALHRDKNADKIAFNSTLDDACGAYNQKLDRMMQYSCDSPQALVYYNTPQDKPWSVELIADNIFYPNRSVVPYHGGIIGVSYGGSTDSIPPGFLVSVNETGTKRYHQHPDNSNISELDEARIFTDTYNQENERFVLVEKNGSIQLGTPDSDVQNPKVTYTTIPAPANYKSEIQQTICQLQNASVICYRGLSSTIGDTTEETKKIQPEIIKLNFGSDKVTTIPLEDTSLIFNFVVTNDNQLYGLSFKKLVRFVQKGDSYLSEEISQNVDSIAGNDTLYFLQNTGVFAVDPASHDANQVFYSHNVKPNKILSAGGKIFILGKSANSTANTYAWKLNNDDDLNYSNRLIDILPSFPSSSAYGTTDLAGNMIEIQVNIDRTDTPADIRRRKQATLDYLKDLGVNLDQVTIANF